MLYRLPPNELGMVVDRGYDFPHDIQDKLDSFGKEMWSFRDDSTRETTKALNLYKGDFRNFEYLTPRVRITPKDLTGTKIERPTTLHFICSPSRALTIMSEVRDVKGWKPITIYEPIPLVQVHPRRTPSFARGIILDLDFKIIVQTRSPNAEEALSLLSIKADAGVTHALVEEAGQRFVGYGIGGNGDGTVIIRSGNLGAYVASRARKGRWVRAFWGAENAHKVVDVTGAGNAFLGGLSAGLLLANQDVFQAVLYATVSASFIIEQEGLPSLTATTDGSASELWNGDSPQERLEKLRMDTKFE